MDLDEETWLTGPVATAPATKAVTASTATQSSQSDLENWLNSTPSIDFSTRSALSRKLKVYSEKKARRAARASITSLESLMEEASPKASLDGESPSTTPTLSTSTVTMFCNPPTSPVSMTDSPLVLSLPLMTSSPLTDAPPPSLSIDQLETLMGDLDLEESDAEEDDDEFYDAPSDFEDNAVGSDDVTPDATNGHRRQSDLEKVNEEPPMPASRLSRLEAEQQPSRTGPRSVSISPRVSSLASSPASTGGKSRQSEHSATPLSARQPQASPLTPHSANKTTDRIKQGSMSVSLHTPSDHLPPPRQPRSTSRGPSPSDKRAIHPPAGIEGGKVNLHEDLRRITDLAREQEEALRREVMGSWQSDGSAASEDTTDGSSIPSSKSVEFLKKTSTPISRLPTPSRRVLPPGRRTAIPAPSLHHVGGGTATRGGGGTVAESRSAASEEEGNECF